MADENNKTRTQNEKAGASASEPKVNTDAVDDLFREANEKGYIGQVPDETPNEEYTFNAQAKKVNGNGK